MEKQDGVFNTGDSILFYGQAINTKYTNANVYWLSWGVCNGLRMAQKIGTPSGTAIVPDSFPVTVHVEEDHYYLSSRPSGAKHDHWAWDLIYGSGAGATQMKSYRFQLILPILRHFLFLFEDF